MFLDLKVYLENNVLSINDDTQKQIEHFLLDMGRDEVKKNS